MNKTEWLLALGAVWSVISTSPALADEPTAQKSKAALVLQNENGAVPAQDYPPSSYRASEEGKASFKVWADANGKLLDCQITKSSGFKALDDQTCASLRQRGQFAASGAPNEADGRYSMTDNVQWMMATFEPRPLFLGVTLTSSQPMPDDRTRCSFSDGVVRFVAKARPCVLDTPRQTSANGSTQTIVDRYIELFNADPKPEYAFNAGLILATGQYSEAADYLVKASDKGLGLASFIMCGLYATAQNPAMNLYQPKEAVRRCLLAHEQGFDLGLVLIREFLTTHPDAANSDERQFITTYQPKLPIATTAAVLTIPGNALIRQQDYPKDEAKHKIQGRSVAFFKVTPQGRVQDCIIMQSSLSYALDETVCRRLREAGIYTPATLMGQPTEMWTSQAVSWQADRNSNVLGGTILGSLLGAIIGHTM